MMQKQQTDYVSQIEQRDIHFDLDGIPRHWHGGHLHITQLFNALSVFFPEGERFFIRSVRHFRADVADPELQQQVKGFIGQEAMHGREHDAYNAMLRAQGYPVDAQEKLVLRLLKFAYKILPKKNQLAITVALEHFTAMLAGVLLKDERVLKGAAPPMAALWRWHAVEETEHKAVAFDVYQIVAPGFFNYLRRCFEMLMVTAFFLPLIVYYHARFVIRAGGFWDVRGWLDVWAFVLFKPGAFTRIIPSYFSYFRPGFHPWDEDNRAHVEQWKLHYLASPPAS